jgi:hypothetical protein
LAGIIIETAQYFGFSILGQTFDPLDYAAYALGLSLAVMLDTYLFPRVFSFWQPENQV